jgi:hypothetical protein
LNEITSHAKPSQFFRYDITTTAVKFLQNRPGSCLIALHQATPGIFVKEELVPVDSKEPGFNISLTMTSENKD